MEQTRLMMGMPITVKLIDQAATEEHVQNVFKYFQYIDDTFSTYKPTSNISRINDRTLHINDASPDVRTIIDLAEITKQETNGFFDIYRHGRLDPLGLVKGWAIQQATEQLLKLGLQNFFLDVGGDISAMGVNEQKEPWRVGIRNPFQRDQNIKILSVTNAGVATSGTYIRGQHIYNPKQPNEPIHDIISLTVVGPTIYDADRYATAAFAMGKTGIHFIDQLPDYEGYMIDVSGQATITSRFNQYVVTV